MPSPMLGAGDIEINKAKSLSHGAHTMMGSGHIHKKIRHNNMVQSQNHDAEGKKHNKEEHTM